MPLLRMEKAAGSMSLLERFFTTLLASILSPGCCIPCRCSNFRFCFVVVVACMLQASAVFQLSFKSQSSVVTVPASSRRRWNNSLVTESSLLRV
jgi:hypothetical protein